MIKTSQKLGFLLDSISKEQIYLNERIPTLRNDYKKFRIYCDKLGFLNTFILDLILSIKSELKGNEFCVFGNEVLQQITCNQNNLKPTPRMLQAYEHMDYFEQSSQNMISKYIMSMNDDVNITDIIIQVNNNTRYSPQMCNCIKLLEHVFFYWHSKEYYEVINTVNNFEQLLTNIQVKYSPLIGICSYITNLDIIKHNDEKLIIIVNYLHNK